MEKQWFVLHTLTGQEMKVKHSIECRMQQEEMQDLIGGVTIPSEKVSEVKRGKKTTTIRKFYPGYVLIEAQIYNDQGGFNERTWYFIRETPGVIGFVGGEKPVPLKPEEVENILNQAEEKKETVRPKIAFDPGETIKINDGPFLNFNGVI